ncbi:Ca2+-binding RTX toxin-like protein [Actinoplanes lutulentus]|uniref:Hemolysin type calcium-binding protein n=1 Tax=Actinoplanes lutulentus TaxID=1287878 RepID=A0A327Z1F4_9ACTN|nr:calcium-binding protein [Actinoplanes lutulentus]MBB2943179.1 Ca2+-binding RTX toxin-like protein [Actinoplanes lutulentus]RAK28245.1 hemolysin type calcium-binding protein [Actinoplanes lutulentus]
MMISRIGMVLLTTIGVGVLAAPAQAASTGVVSVSKTTQVKYTAGSGKANKVVITRSGRTVTIDDKVKIKAGKGCKTVKGDKTKVRCKLTKNPTRVHVQAGSKNDTVVNKTGIRVTLEGGSGNDILVGGSNLDRLFGGSGADKLYGGDNNDVLYGGTGNDKLYGQDGGGDYLYGDENDDALYGGEGDDKIFGGAGNDKLYGERHYDKLEGGAGNDYVNGGAGSDILWGDVKNAPAVIGADVILGGPDNDTVNYDRPQATADLDGVKGDDGAPGEGDTLGTDVENLAGNGAGDYTFTGNNADNLLWGAAGDDVIHGGGGDDDIRGNAGANKLYGNAGDDKIHGSDYYQDAADTVDGGANSELIGDLCWVSKLDVATACERLP